jgi:hypothetical protein
MKDRLWIHVIYFNPKDYPGKYVVRRQSPNEDGTILIDKKCTVTSTLGLARVALHSACPGLFRIDRHPEDAAVIVESWI